MGQPVERFEDLIAWQKARALTKDIYRASGTGEFARDFGLRNQIQRAAVSVMSNIAEGFDRNRPTEFHQFLSVAKASCAELRSQLYVTLDVCYVDEPTFQVLLQQSQEVGRVISGLRTAVQRRIKG